MHPSDCFDTPSDFCDYPISLLLYEMEFQCNCLSVVYNILIA